MCVRHRVPRRQPAGLARVFAFYTISARAARMRNTKLTTGGIHCPVGSRAITPLLHIMCADPQPMNLMQAQPIPYEVACTLCKCVVVFAFANVSRTFN